MAVAHLIGPAIVHEGSATKRVDFIAKQPSADESSHNDCDGQSKPLSKVRARSQRDVV